MEIDFVRTLDRNPVLADFGQGGGTPLIVNAQTGESFLRVLGRVARATPIALSPSGDDTEALNDALATGQSIVLNEGLYRANNLTQSVDGQRIYALGRVRIQKDADGPLFTSSGANVQIHGVEFVGTGFTGDNVVASGAHFSMLDCGSRGAAGRAVKATGSHCQIIGTCDIYQSAGDWDIEIGKSGTATLYHRISGTYSSQASGGILLVDVGSAIVSESQFGKLKIAAGTKPAGVNGGITTGCRILGAVDVELSSAVFVGNQFGAVQVTFANGTSGCRMSGDANVFAVGAAITNNGNSTNNPNVHPTL